MSKKTEYARWVSIMKKLDNRLRKAQEEKKAKSKDNK